MVALASVGTAIIVTDAKARLVSMNPIAESLTGSGGGTTVITCIPVNGDGGD